jgi:predicted deacetylase
MKRSVKRKGIIVLLILAIFVVILFIIRLVNSSEIDDVTPSIPCPEIVMYNPDTLYVIPNYNNNSISSNKEWCNYILSLNKTLELHGITHTYNEFLYKNISQIELTKGIVEFEKCFNKTPEMFKPPQLKISLKNKQLIKNNNLKLRNRFNQITHKVYHCNDSDKIPNRIVNIF